MINEYEIITTFLNNIENEIIIDNFLSNIKNYVIEYKVHPIANMIKESFYNINNGDHIGFKKQFFIKCCRNGSTTSGCSTSFEVCRRGSEDYYNNDYFLNRFKKHKVKKNDVIEYKVHPIANMIKESFRNIGDSDILGFHESYFLNL